MDSERISPDEERVNILGTPLGSNLFVSSYLQKKGLKHRLLLQFIQDVATAAFPREAEQKLKGAAIPRLSHILRSVQKNHHSLGWMKEMDGAHLSAWLHYLSSSEDLEHALGAHGRDQLAAQLDLPAAYGGAGLQSLESFVDEEFLGSFAAITTSLIAFCKNVELLVYTRIAQTLEALEETEGSQSCTTTKGIVEVYDTYAIRRVPLS